jgi:hypothetical protein
MQNIHWINLAKQPLFKLNMVCKLENLLQTLYDDFNKSFKK